MVPHHEAVMVRELCIAIDVYIGIENFLYFLLHLIYFLIALYNYILLLCVYGQYEIKMMMIIISETIRFNELQLLRLWSKG